jgi:hypothetical protein
VLDGGVVAGGVVWAPPVDGLAGAAPLSGAVVGGLTGAGMDGELFSGGAAAGADGLAGALICDESLVAAELLVAAESLVVAAVLAVEPVLAPPLAAAISIDFRSAREAWR